MRELLNSERVVCPVCNSPLYEGITVVFDKEKKQEVCSICKSII